MKFKLYRPEQSQEVPETGIASALRNVVSSGAKTVSSLAQIPTVPETLWQHAEQTRNRAIEHALLPGNEANLYGSNPEDTRKGLEKLKANPFQPKIAPIVEKGHRIAKNIFPEGYLEPKSEGEETFQDYASLIPLHLVGGGSIKSIPSFLAKVGAGRFAGQKVEEAGGGTLGRLATEIAVPGILEGLNLQNIKKYFEPYKKDTYKDLPVIAGNTKISASSLEDKLEDAWKNSIGRKGESSIRKSLQIIQDEIKDGHIDLNKLQPLKKKLNNLIYEDNRQILKPVLGEVFSMIDKHPEYAQALKKADKLHSTFANLENSESFINELKNVKGYKTKVGLFGKAFRLLYKAPTTQSINLLSKLGRQFPKETLNYATKSLEAATRKQAPQFIKELTNLQKLIDKVDTEETLTEGKTFKLYRSA